MNFALGYIAGLVTSAFLFAVLAFFRAGIEKRVRIIENTLGNAGPKPKGAIFLPDDDATVARREHIEKNKRQGRDTPFSELQ